MNPMPLQSVNSQQIISAHQRIRNRYRIYLATLFLLLIIGIICDIMTGPAGLTFSQIIDGLRGRDNTLFVIMWQVRLPTAALAVSIGISLSLAGAEMQTILFNPLASPFTLGVSSAAAFGAAVAIVLGISFPFLPTHWSVPANAFLMAFGSIMLIQLFASRQKSSSALVLFGIAFVFGFNALIAVIQFMAPADSLQQLIFWTMGGLTRADMTSVIIMVATLLIIIPFSLRAANALTLLSLGEERAASLGVSIRHIRFGCLLRASLLAAISVSFAGTIGFIGLVGPHISRLLVGEDHRYFLPGAMLSGGVIMSFASIASKLIIPGVLLPIGIVTSLIGLPCFMALLLSKRVLR